MTLDEEAMNNPLTEEQAKKLQENPLWKAMNYSTPEKEEELEKELAKVRAERLAQQSEKQD